MIFEKLTRSYMFVVLAAGLGCVGSAVVSVPRSRVDIYFLLLFCFTIGVGSRITVKIPKLKSHIAVSDTFIFLALLLFGGELAIILAAIEAFFSSWRFCSKKLTVFFNSSVMAVSTLAVVVVLELLGLSSEGTLHGHPGNVQDFVVALAVIALTQFVVNTTLASVHDMLRDGLPLWETWKSKYLWTFITYIVGAASAGVLVQLSESIGFGVVIAAFPVIYLIFLSYKMYLANVEISMRQAEQAEQYANVLEERSAALRESEERFRSAFNYAPIGIALVSPAGDWLKVNRELCKILGYTEQEFLATNFQSMLYREDLGVTLIKIHELSIGKIANCQMEQRYVHKSGRTVWASWSVSADTDVRNENSNFIFQIQDITQKMQAEQKLKHEATHDALTGLPNRSFFMTRLSQALQRSGGDRSHSVSVLFIDLDRFKNVNDSLGHVAGDLLLVNIADRLRECLRPSDIVARLGGDEFTILVEGKYARDEVTHIAERILQKFNDPFDLHGHEVYSSASIGVLHASAAHTSSEDIMRDADTAMYHAKRAGKGRHEMFDENMHEAAKETLRLETDLRRAVENKEFSILYQPIFSIASGRIESVEALARWEHPALGTLSPRKFVPLAEEIGLIDALSEQILLRACREMGTAFRLRDDLHGVRLSVNLSSRQFSQPALVDRIAATLAECEFPPTRLKIEITESVFFEHQEKAIEMLHVLRSSGIDIDIDDFGTGYSNLSYLVRLPISSLKIDRSFIKPITEGCANTEIVRTIIALARNLGLRVVAEGVETTAQLEALRLLECEGAQGYLLARPMSFEKICDYFASLPADGVSRVPHLELELASPLQQ
jgi:diguanylate cyclase (GGDEF)-like protein/PAS domain S-box-containing protein